MHKSNRRRPCAVREAGHEYVSRIMQATEAPQVSDARADSSAGRDRVVVREGLELVAASLCVSRRLLALALI